MGALVGEGATSLPLVPPLVASSIVPSVSTARPAPASNCSGSPASRPSMSSFTDSRVTGGTLGGGVLGGGMGGGGGGEGWMVWVLVRPSSPDAGEI